MNVQGTKIDLDHAESKVVFYFYDISLKKDYSFYKLSREQAKRLIKRLIEIEKKTWNQFLSSGREKGLTSEKPGGESFEMIKEQDSSEKQIVGERYYFHFRIEQKGKFRVFGYQRDQFFCITHLDPKHKIHSCS